MIDRKIDSAIQMLSISQENDKLEDVNMEGLKVCLAENGKDEKSQDITKDLGFENAHSHSESNLSTQELIQAANTKETVLKELFQIILEETRHRMPSHLIKSGHRFSLANCHIRSYQDENFDERNCLSMICYMSLMMSH